MSSRQVLAMVSPGKASPPAGPYRLIKLVLLSFCLIPVVNLAGATDVLTYHNDNARTGQNLNETILTTSNVNSTTFGKLFALSVDGKVDAQPLYMAAVTVPGRGTHNILIVATEHASVYAFDADTGMALWQVSLLKPGETPSDDRGCDQVTPEIGVTATPVIDRNSGPNGTIYAVAMSKDGSGNYFQRLHALDVTTGQEEFGGPKDIQATFPGTGDNSVGGNVIFDPKQYKERPGLLLLNNVVYTSWSSHCDIRPYTGWVIGYDERTLARVSVLNITPNGNEGSVWASGAGPAADSSGNIYFLAANGTFDTTLNSFGFPIQGDYGNAFLKLSTSGNNLSVADYFNMFNTVAESGADQDLGSGGALVLPDLTDAQARTRHLAVGAGKDANIYLADRDNMGKFNPNNNNALYQELVGALGGEEFGMPAYFNGKVYYGAVGDNLLAFQISNARLLTSPASKTGNTFGFPGTTPSISANGASEGIVWAAENAGVAVLHAYDAADLSRELYNSNQAAGGRDHFGAGNKFITPTIAGGKVFVGTTNGVGVFGLLVPPAAQLSPASLTFDFQAKGTTSSAKPVTLSNTSSGTLAISGITASGDFGQSNNCGSSVLPGNSCVINVTFTPTAAGSRTGTLTVTDNAPGSPQTVSLSGTGTDFSITVASGSSSGASVTAGQTGSYTLTLGGSQGFNGMVTIACTGAPQSSTCAVTPNSVALNGTSGTNVTVSVATTAHSMASRRPLWPPLGPSTPAAYSATWLVTLLILSALALLSRAAGRSLRWPIFAALLLAAMALASCGGAPYGSGGISGTPAGTYTLTTTGTYASGSTALNHNMNLTLTVY